MGASVKQVCGEKQEGAAPGGSWRGWRWRSGVQRGRRRCQGTPLPLPPPALRLLLLSPSAASAAAGVHAVAAAGALALLRPALPLRLLMRIMPLWPRLRVLPPCPCCCCCWAAVAVLPFATAPASSSSPFHLLAAPSPPLRPGCVGLPAAPRAGSRSFPPLPAPRFPRCPRFLPSPSCLGLALFLSPASSSLTCPPALAPLPSASPLPGLGGSGQGEQGSGGGRAEQRGGGREAGLQCRAGRQGHGVEWGGAEERRRGGVQRRGAGLHWRAWRQSHKVSEERRRRCAVARLRLTLCLTRRPLPKPAERCPRCNTTQRPCAA